MGQVSASPGNAMAVDNVGTWTWDLAILVRMEGQCFLRSIWC